MENISMQTASRGKYCKIESPKIIAYGDKNCTDHPGKDAEVLDLYSEHLRELFKINNPSLIGKSDYTAKLNIYLEKNRHSDLNSGRWIYLPWKNTFIHTLNELDYYTVRTARNKELVTQTEQELFRNSTVAIAGLSVGNSVAINLTMTGGPKKIKIADFDTLDLSNLNRLRGSITYLGKSKVELLAHQIWEVDPDADIETFPDGLNKLNLKSFILHPKVDVVVDEMDDLLLKILLRVEARRAKIPVIMATDNEDGVLLDIERFDQEPNRPIFHGLLEDIDVANLPPNMSMQDRINISSKIVGENYISTRMQGSLKNIGVTIATWPQLGTAASISGAIAAYAIRRIVTRQKLPSQRLLFTPNQLME